MQSHTLSVDPGREVLQLVAAPANAVAGKLNQMQALPAQR